MAASILPPIFGKKLGPGRYRWLGLGDELINQNHRDFNLPGSSAFSSLDSGNFQEWQLGLEANIPIGFRRELSGIRHQELLLARERAILCDLELEVSHQLGDSIRDIDNNYGLTQTNFNRRVAAEAEVQAVNASYEAGRVPLDLLLDAQRRRAEAESAYYRSLVDYNRSIMNVHYRKGSLLDYDGVYLAEGQWPAKAYFDAMRQARKRDAALFIDYGYDEARTGSTLQAVRAHEKVDPFAAPGEADLTALVDFATLSNVALARDCRVLGTVTQGDWLRALGIDMRARALAAAAPAHAAVIERARHRLTAADQMGDLFKVMGLAAPGWPKGEGF